MSCSLSAALGPAALLASLEADGVDAYRRLVERTGLAVGKTEVEALLAAPEGGGEARWTSLVLQERKRPLVLELIAQHERLRSATLSGDMLVAAARAQAVPPALWLLEQGVLVDTAV